MTLAMLLPGDASEFARWIMGERTHWLRNYRQSLYDQLQVGLDDDDREVICRCAERISKINAELRRRGDE